MVARLKKIDPVASHPVNQSVFLGDPTRPGSCQKMPQRFGLANPGEWIAQHGFRTRRATLRSVSTQ
jgi:hypothetical protein